MRMMTTTTTGLGAERGSCGDDGSGIQREAELDTVSSLGSAPARAQAQAVMVSGNGSHSHTTTVFASILDLCWLHTRHG